MVDNSNVGETEEPAPVSNSYRIKPSLNEKFKDGQVKEIIRNILAETLAAKKYDSENVKEWIVSIANQINAAVKELRLKRYKHIVQVNLGERKGQGVKSGVLCLWDSETDAYTSETFINDSIFCVVTVFAVYLY